MEYRQLGQSDLKVSAVTLGAWAIGGLFWGGTDEQQSIEAIQASIDAGVTTIDTAPVYGCGKSEEIVGKAIKGRRHEVQILTKFGLRWDIDKGTEHFDVEQPEGGQVRIHKFTGKASIIEECENSLRRLGIDEIDLYQQHWPDPGIHPEEAFAAVEKLLRDGKIRAAGVCNHSPEQMEAVRAVFPIVSNQPPFSMVRRDIEQDVIPYCQAGGLGVIVYSPMQLGLLTGKVTMDREFPPSDVRSRSPYFKPENRRRVLDFLARIQPIADDHGVTLAQLVVNWTIHRPGITAALVGARNPRQARENAGAAAFAGLEIGRAHV